MDARWQPYDLDSKRDVRIYLHAESSFEEVRNGTGVGVDISEFVSNGSHTLFDCNITLNWNRELFGVDNQPAPNQILEIQLYQGGVYKTVWIGIIDTISGYTVQRGERSMQLIARSRDSLDIFRTTKRVTQLFPQMTDFAYIARMIARSAGLSYDEIVLPTSSFSTAHSNTQLAEMSAWEMLSDVFLPMGWTPFIDGLGRLRAAERNLMSISPIELSDEQLVRVVAQRQRPPATRLRVKWRNPLLKKSLQQGRKLAEEVITMGWFLPFLNKTVYFSDDKTQRAVDTYMVKEHSANSFFGVGLISEHYEQLEQNKGRIKLTNWYFLPTMAALITSWAAAHNTPDTVTTAPGLTTPTGRRLEAYAQFAFTMFLLAIGTGVYEIWGTPYEWVHARNTTEAFDAHAPTFVDNPVEIETDFIMNEQHAQAVAVRELIYQSRSANKWTVLLVDDPRIEYGDVVQFYDGSRMYVEDISRPLARGSEATIQVSGFLVGGSAEAVDLDEGGTTPTAPVEVIEGSTSMVTLPTVPAGLSGRALWVGYFFSVSDRYGDNLTAPGNCAYCDTEEECARSPWPYYSPLGIGDSGNKIANIVSGNDSNPLPVGLPANTVCLWDGGSVLPVGPCGDVTGLECYSDPGESFETIDSRMRAWLDANPSARVVLIGQGYTRNGTETDTQKLADLQGLPFSLANDYPQVEGVLIFSDGRMYGTRDNEWWRPVHTQAAELVSAPPVVW